MTTHFLKLLKVFISWRDGKQILDKLPKTNLEGGKQEVTPITFLSDSKQNDLLLPLLGFH
jgi:hypothetical protein